jgi:BolA protein
MSTERMQLLEQRLQALQPSHLEIIDESHLHAGHAGSRNGASHFRVIVWAPAFQTLSAVARHRAVYDLVNDLIPYPIHALAIVAKPNP